MSSNRVIAIHLPQYHPIPENDQWWGKGFTEWTNVTKAIPLFSGHYQPQLPADLGFYDLRLEEARLAQEALAKEYGIHGFCYYHYWFNGQRILNEPVDRKLENPKEDFPFMLCWANENWTRRWDGMEQDILLKQEYSYDDDLRHIQFLIKHYFIDNRYVKVDGKPFIAIYRPSLFPNISLTLQIWNEEAKKNGFNGIYTAYMQSFNFKVEPSKLGFDSAIEFQPDFFDLPVSVNLKGSMLTRLLNKLHIKKSIYTKNRVIDYGLFVNHMIEEVKPNYKYYPCVSPSWDNSARKSDAIIVHGHTPELYEKWLDYSMKKFQPFSNEENFIFINAWNEWAEGNHLEPDQKWGKRFLEKTKIIIDKWNNKNQ